MLECQRKTLEWKMPEWVWKVVKPKVETIAQPQSLTNSVTMIRKLSGIMQRAFLTVTKPMPVGRRCLEWKNQPLQPLHQTKLGKVL